MLRLYVVADDMKKNIIKWLTNTNLVESRGNLLGKQKLFCQIEKGPKAGRYSLNNTRHGPILTGFYYDNF